MPDDSDGIVSVTTRGIKMIFLSVLVGALAVPIIISLTWLTGEYFALVSQADFLSPYLGRAWIVPPMLLGGLIVGLIVHRLAPEAEGPGAHIVIAAFHKREGKLRRRTGIIKYIATIITVGSGSPNGLVSPSTLLGNSVSGYVERFLEIDDDSRKTLALCGMAAALSALLGAPLGAAVFAVEVVYGDRILYRRFFYCLISSIAAYLLALWVGFRTTFLYLAGSLPELSPEIMLYVFVTAIVVTVLNILYIRLYQNIHDFFLSWSWKSRNWLEPSMGMLIAAVLMAPLFTTMRSMGVVGGGYAGIIESTDLHIITLTGVILTVIIATAFITGTGGSGGLFMPIMFIGNLMGLLIASVTSFPHPVILAAVGISASLCTTLNIPLASALISIELFGPIAVLPSIVGALIGYILGKKYTIYHEIRWNKLR